MAGTVTIFGATHYRWRADVKRLVRRYEARFQTKANTYDDHPTGWHLDNVSVDFWAPAGRGYSIDPQVGLRIVHKLKEGQHRHPWRWLIYRGRIQYPSGYSQAYWDPTDQHFDHVHVTFA